ncbi:MAG: RNA methyltransferase [Candidatus Euphemobacter frigidus]|nr:RNA methyltransferase [Candidatus Euphemobacter frigidus]MDP8275254.1 RNA methyltransferase [Candidatus Euphemobacter frigidus]
MITSPHNPRIKILAALHQSRTRRETGLTLIEGVRPAREALTHAKIRTLVLSEKLCGNPEGEALKELAQQRDIEVLVITEGCYRKISGLRHPEGAAVVIVPVKTPASDILKGESRLVVTAGIQDPGNAGAIVRTAEAAGATGCLLLGGVDITHPRFLRAAMGSSFRLPCAAAGVVEFIAEAQKTPLRILAATTSGPAVHYNRADYRSPVAICIGGEGRGLPEEIERAADFKIAVPMSGRVESLNAAVAAGIILYQARMTWIKP